MGCLEVIEAVPLLPWLHLTPQWVPGVELPCPIHGRRLTVSESNGMKRTACAIQISIPDPYPHLVSCGQ